MIEQQLNVINYELEDKDIKSSTPIPATFLSNILYKFLLL